MWGFELQPLSGEAPVTVPPGETVLGRGPLLGISDKRVSRNHALLENCDGRLRLKSTHVNPCFLQTSSDPVPCPLQRDTWTELRHGDTLSLLPGHLCYKVVFNKPDQDQELDQDFDQDMEVDLGTKGSPEEETEERLEGTQKNSEVLEDEEEGPTNVKSPPVGLDHTQTPPTNRMNQSDEEEDGDSPNKTQSVPRRRTLPSWMMSAAQASPSSSSTYSPKVVKRSKTPSSTQTTPPVTPLKKAPPPVTSSSKKAPPPATSSSQKAPPLVTSSQKRAPPPSVMSSSEGAGLSEEEEEEQRPRKKRKMNGSERAPETSAAAAPSPDPRRDPSPDPSPDPVPVKTTSSTKTNRTPCPYGKDCYRKNPIHFQEQSHPGDSDYEDPDKDQDQDQEDSDRPECPYGTDCYRKNPLHRKEFKHSKRPARKTRTAPTRRGPDDNDDEEDEYDSSFIDDDSDYDPGKDRSESESEDLSLLKTEAAIFTKKRK